MFFNDWKRLRAEGKAEQRKKLLMESMRGTLAQAQRDLQTIKKLTPVQVANVELRSWALRMLRAAEGWEEETRGITEDK